MTGRPGHQGEVVEGARCPRCRGEIVYNGNYFCDRIGDGCDYALADTKSAWNRHGRAWYTQLMKQRGL